MRNLIAVSVAIGLLAGCAAGPAQVNEDTAVVDLSRINLAGDPSGPWANQYLTLGLGKDRAAFYGGSVAVPKYEVLSLRAYAINQSFSYDFSRYSPYRGFYPFDIKAKYGEGYTYTFGPFEPNKCYVAYLEPVSIAPHEEKIRSVSGVAVGSRKVRYEFQARSDLINCETIGENDEFDYTIF